MDEVKYVEAYGEFVKLETPFKDAAERTLRHASPEHKPTMIVVKEQDAIQCACGWQSLAYWSGVDLAMRKWREHVMEILGEDPDLGCGCS